jgi:hypothetical protein
MQPEAGARRQQGALIPGRDLFFYRSLVGNLYSPMLSLSYYGPSVTLLFSIVHLSYSG